MPVPLLAMGIMAGARASMPLLKDAFGTKEITSYNPTHTFYGNPAQAGSMSGVGAGYEFNANPYQETVSNNFGKFLDILAPTLDTGMSVASLAAKSGIYIKPSKRGSLRKHLGVSKGDKIPSDKLKIKSTDSEAIRKKKQFAINARKWKKGEDGLFVDGNRDNTNVQRYPIEMKLLADQIAKERGEVESLPGYGMSGAVDLDTTPWEVMGGIRLGIGMGQRFGAALADELTMGGRSIVKGGIKAARKPKLGAKGQAMRAYRKNKEAVEEGKEFLSNWIEDPETLKRMENTNREFNRGVPDDIYRLTLENKIRDPKEMFIEALSTSNRNAVKRKNLIKSGELSPEDRKNIMDIRLTTKEAKGSPKRYDYDEDYVDYIQKENIGGVSFHDRPSYVLTTRGPHFSLNPERNEPLKYFANKILEHPKFNVVDAPFVKSTAIHEGAHNWQRELPFTEKERNILNEIVTPISDAEMAAKNKSKKWGRSYYADPKEIHARMMEMRAKMGKTPGDVITRQEVDNFLESKNEKESILEMFKYVDKDKFTEAINKIRGVVIPATVGAGVTLEANQNKPNMKKGGFVKSIQPINGPSHEQGGIDKTINGEQVEVEGGEYQLEFADGSKAVFNKEQMAMLQAGVPIDQIIATMPTENVMAKCGIRIGKKRKAQNGLFSYIPKFNYEFSGGDYPGKGFNNGMGYSLNLPSFDRSYTPSSGNDLFGYPYNASGIRSTLPRLSELGAGAADGSPSGSSDFFDSYNRMLKNLGIAGGATTLGTGVQSAVDMWRNERESRLPLIPKTRYSPINYRFMDASPYINALDRGFSSGISMARRTGRPELIAPLLAQRFRGVSDLTRSVNERDASMMDSVNRTNLQGFLGTARTNAEIDAMNVSNRFAEDRLRSEVRGKNIATLFGSGASAVNLGSQYGSNRLSSDIMRYLYNTLKPEQLIMMQQFKNLMQLQ